MLALYLILSSVAAAYCLLGYWFAFGKLPWLWRAAVTCATLALLVPVSAYEPLVFFGITSLIFAGIAWSQSLWAIWRESRQIEDRDESSAGPKSNVHRQFQLRDLMGLTAIFGVSAWIVRIILNEQVWLSWVALAFTAAVCVALTLLLARFFHGPKRLLSLGLAIPFGIAAAYASGLFVKPGPSFPRSILLAFLCDWVVAQGPPLGILLFFFSCFVVFGLWIHCGFKPKDNKSLLVKISLVLSGLMALAWGSAFVWLYIQMLPLSQPSTPPARADNSYAAVVRQIQGFGNLTPEPADAKSREVAELLKKECFVVVPWNATFMERKNYFVMLKFEFEDLRYLGTQFDGQAAALEPTHPDLAADRVIDILHLGEALGHDGLLGHTLVGMNIEGTAHWRIVPFRRKLSPQKARELLSELQRIEQGREPSKIALERQELWTRLNDRWEYRLYEICVAPPEDTSLRQNDPGVVLLQRTRERACCCSRLLITDLAIQLYRAEEGKLPNKLEDLAPRYLKEIPNDFFTDKLPIYRPSGDTYLLYSVGSHGIDNGGRFEGVMKFPSIECDWNLDSLTRP